MRRIALWKPTTLTVCLALAACPAPADPPRPVIADASPRTSEAAQPPSQQVPSTPVDEDGDGFAGTRDRCPNQSETWNDLDDQDGCPEDSPPLVSLEEGGLRWHAPLVFELGKPRLTPDSLPSIRAAAALVGARRDLRVVVAYRYRTNEECKDDQNRSAPIGRGRIRTVLDALIASGAERNQVRPEGPGDYGPRARTLGPGISIVIDDTDLAGPMSSHCEMAVAARP